MKKNQSTQPKANASEKTQSPASAPALSKMNLSQFAKELEGINPKEKKNRETIYIYPEGKSKEWINSEDGKKFRNRMRNAMQKFCNNILLYAKKNRIEDLQKEIASFMDHYKKSYRVNDLSLNSISNSLNEEKGKEFTLMLSIIKESTK